MSAPTVSLIISGLALALGLYNAVEARRASRRVRQQELWDELRSTLEAVQRALKEGLDAYGSQRDLPTVPEVFPSAERRLKELAPRFVDRMHPDIKRDLETLAYSIATVTYTWKDAIRAQVDATGKDGGPEAQKREESRNKMRSATDNAQMATYHWIRRIDARDRGERINWYS